DGSDDVGVVAGLAADREAVSVGAASLRRLETHRVAHALLPAALRLSELDALEEGDDAREKPLALDGAPRVPDLRLAPGGGDQQIDADVGGPRRVVRLGPASRELGVPRLGRGEER